MFDPVAFTILGHDFRWYGLLVAAGFLLACINWNALDRRAGFPAGFGSEFGFVVMTSGLIGSRLGFVLGEWRHFAADPMDIFRVNSGGMVFYGGFLLATFCTALLARLRKIRALDLMDYGVAGLALGHGVGRIGCFLNGCCYGRETDSMLGCLTHGANRLPTQLFEAIFNIALCAFLNWFYLKRRTFRGQVFALYIAIYACWRFAIEFFRADNRVFVGGMSSGQWVSVGLLVLAAVLFVGRSSRLVSGPEVRES